MELGLIASASVLAPTVGRSGETTLKVPLQRVCDPRWGDSFDDKDNSSQKSKRA